jgi:hypothetical protein
VAERSWNDADFVCVSCNYRGGYDKVCDACGDVVYIFRSVCSASEDSSVLEASTAVDRKSMGHTVAERSWKDPDFVSISCIQSGGFGIVL